MTLVQQEHVGSNGVKFMAWTFMETDDPVRAVLEAQEMKYNNVKLGPVVKIKHKGE